MTFFFPATLVTSVLALATWNFFDGPVSSRANGAEIRLPRDQKKGQEIEQPLTHEEEAMVRRVMYEGILPVGMVKDAGGSPIRTAILRPAIIELHKTKRIAVLRLLLEIAKGGRPSDALAAAGHAVGLEGHFVLAAECGTAKRERFDELQNRAGLTFRQELVARIELDLAKNTRKSRGVQ